MKGDSLEGSGHTPMYNPNILPLSKNPIKMSLLTFQFAKQATIGWTPFTGLALCIRATFNKLNQSIKVLF